MNTADEINTRHLASQERNAARRAAEVVTYDDLIDTHHQAMLDEEEVSAIRRHFHAVIVDYWNRNPQMYDPRFSEAEKRELSSIAFLDDHLAYLRKPLIWS